MGPTCEVLLNTVEDLTLDKIDSVLDRTSEQIERTRKGRSWNIWVRGQPIHVEITDVPPTVHLSAGCNSTEDYRILGELSQLLADETGGLASKPEK